MSWWLQARRQQRHSHMAFQRAFQELDAEQVLPQCLLVIQLVCISILHQFLVVWKLHLITFYASLRRGLRFKSACRSIMTIIRYRSHLFLALLGSLWVGQAAAQAPQSGSSGYPLGATPVLNSATGTTAGATATLAAAAGQFTYLCGFSVSPGSATTAITITITTTGLASNQTLSVGAPVTAVGTTGVNQYSYFTPCLRSTAVNTAVTVVAGALGTAGVGQAVNAWGYQQ